MDVKCPWVLDVVGAIFLADNGSLARYAALAGRSFKPPTRCFLNPLHGVTGQVQAVTAAGREIKAPLSTACREALRRDRVPDILDVDRRGQAVHYLEPDAEPARKRVLSGKSVSVHVAPGGLSLTRQDNIRTSTQRSARQVT